jgi:uncharacterized protein (UPF0262 family)
VSDPQHRLESVEIDPASLAAGTQDVEHERKVAIFDLLEQNVFVPDGSPGGPYALRVALVENRLALEIKGPEYDKTHLLSLSPFKTVLRDYFIVCNSYFDAIRNSTPGQIEALDMGRRGLHNEGSQLLRERLAGKVETDGDTARRLFTLICALHRRP